MKVLNLSATLCFLCVINISSHVIKTWSHSSKFSTLVVICSKLKDELMSLMAVLILNAKNCRQYMKEARRKAEATGSTRNHKLLWNKIGSDRPPKAMTDSEIQFLPKGPNLIPIQGQPNWYHTILHFRSIPWLITLVDSVRYSITACFDKLLSYFQHFYLAELYPVPTQCSGLPYLNKFLSKIPISRHCWAIRNLIASVRGIPIFFTLLSYTLPYYNVELWPISKYCCRFSQNDVSSRAEWSNTSPKSTNKNKPD